MKLYWCCRGYKGASVCLLDGILHKFKIDFGPLSDRICDAHDRHIIGEITDWELRKGD